MEKSMSFLGSIVCFSNIVTLTKHRILRYESYVFVFCFIAFFLKINGSMTSKFKPHSFPQEIPKTTAGGGILGVKMVPH